MDFHDLQVFVVVAREKSFSRAAKIVFRTQPAVSLAIQRLEAELEEPLFDRSSKEPIMTDEGELLLGYAERLLNLRSEIRPALSELRNLQRGRVRIGANETGALFLLKHIGLYRKCYPHIRVEIVRCFSRDVPQDLLRRNLDLGILTFDPSNANLESTVVYQDRLSLVVYPDHPLAKKKKVSIRKLGNEVFAAHNIKSPYREKVLSVFEKYRAPLRVDMELPTIEAIKRVVGMKHAIAMIPRMCMEEELARGELVEVDVPELRITRKLRVAYRRGDTLSRASSAFLECITTGKCKKEPASKSRPAKGPAKSYQAATAV